MLDQVANQSCNLTDVSCMCGPSPPSFTVVNYNIKERFYSRQKCFLISFYPFAQLSVRLSACISAAPTERIFVKFDIEDFNGFLSRKSTFG
jgi:hypothetical protein